MAKGGFAFVGDGNRMESIDWTITYESGRFNYSFSAPSYFDKCDLVLNARNDVESALKNDIEFEAGQQGLKLPDYVISQQVQRAYAQLYSQCLISDAQGAGGAMYNPSSQNTTPSQVPGAASQPMRYLARIDTSQRSPFDTGAPAVPFRRTIRLPRRRRCR